jgi:hypothetical protein
MSATAASDPLLAIWLQALGEPIGLVLRTSDRERVRTALWSARKRSGDSDLDVLVLRGSPWGEDELVICRASAVAVKEERKDAT